MKFKQSHGQNQRIERITTSHLIIGIDMATELFAGWIFGSMSILPYSKTGRARDRCLL